MSAIVGYIPSDLRRAALEVGLREARLRQTKLVVIDSDEEGPLQRDEDIISIDHDLETRPRPASAVADSLYAHRL